MTQSSESLLNEISVLNMRIVELEQVNQAQQQELLAQQQELLAQQQELLAQQRELQAQQMLLQTQLEELNLYRRKMFGRSAEPHPPQGEVFNEAEAEARAPADVDTPTDDDACEPEEACP
ncbi:hypothetical protein GW952_31430 (plasmid) [Klebsiella michiganensis]|uniref:IS66 family transposase n=1 Tax=Klebsiella michiganensis TaxID=1134687 RepID=A0A6P1V889_9ENTR|nr:hypothetical protein [Klebsiella michiganensis]QHS50117.1 hypothetical protein GW952_31430 [Klebsiella michiganensis]